MALRELVEDLRSALQGSDARCLALEVALRRARNHNLPNYPTSSLNATLSTQNTSLTFSKGKLVPTQRIRGQSSSSVGECVRKVPKRRDTRDPLVRELKLIRASRDGQLEEAIKFNERLEEELRWAYQEVHKLQGVESALRKENTLIRLQKLETEIWINAIRKSSGLILGLHQEAGRGGQGGPEAGAGEGSDDPGAGWVCATVPVQNQPTGGWTTPVQVEHWSRELTNKNICVKSLMSYRIILLIQTSYSS